jgi:ABC-type phosphate/phosphonate transport system permease subunit
MMRRHGMLLTGLVLLIGTVWAWNALGIQGRDLLTGWHNLTIFLHESLPPNWDVWARGWPALVETIQIAYLGTLIGIVFSLWLSERGTHLRVHDG